MKSRKKFPKINQSHLIDQMQAFHAHLGESFSDGGKCNGFSVLIMRAEMIGEQEKFLQRLHILSRANEDKIKKLATLLKEYREHYQKSQPELIKKLKEIRPGENPAEIRKTHLESVEKKALENLTEREKKLLQYAQELYTFSSSLLFAQNPASVNLQVDQRKIGQDDYIDIINVIPPDVISQKNSGLEEKGDSSHKNLTIKRIFKCGFDFEEAELVEVFKKVICENDFVHLYSTNHAMFLFKQKDTYIFYDPNIKEGPIKTKSCEEVVSKIKSSLFANILGWVRSKYLPTGFDIYETVSDAKNERPQIKDVIHQVLKKRGTDPHIDDRGWKGQTALMIALKSANQEICDNLLEMKASPYIADDNGITPATMAVVNGNISFIKTMARQQMHLNKSIKDNITPLLLAASEKQTEILKIILEQHQPDEKIEINHSDDSGDTAAILAAAKGCVEILEILSKYGADFNKENKKGWTPISKAAVKGHLNVLKFLAKQGVDLAKPDRDDYTPLLLAIEKGHLETVKWLARNKISLHQGTKKVIPPIHMAAKWGHGEIVQFLADSKVNLNKKDKTNKQTPAMYAATEGHIHILEILEKNGVDMLNPKVQLELVIGALAADKPEVIKFFIKKGFNINKKYQGQTLATAAAELGRPNILKLLSELKANLSRRGEQGMTLAYMAANKDHVDVLEVLNDCKDVDFNKTNKSGLTPLKINMMNANEKVIEFFINKRPEDVIHYLMSLKKLNDVPDKFKTFLKKQRIKLNNAFLKLLNKAENQEQYQKMLDDFKNKTHGFAELFVNADLISYSRTLLSKSSSKYIHILSMIINALRNEEICLLDMIANFNFTQYKDMWIEVANNAALEGEVQTIETLAKLGFNFYTSDPLGWNPIFKAASTNKVEVLNMFAKLGLNLNISDNSDGWTPLLTAARNGHFSSVKMLCDQKGIDVNEPNKLNGITALHRAASEGHLDVVELLLERKANINCKDHAGLSPAKYAIEKGHIEIVELLIKQGMDLKQVDNQGRNLLLIAAENGQDEIFQMLTQLGLQLDMDSIKALTPAAVEFYIADYPEKFIKLLLSLPNLNDFHESVRHTIKNYSKEISNTFSTMLSDIPDEQIRKDMIKDLLNNKNALAFIFAKPQSIEIDFSFTGMAKSVFGFFWQNNVESKPEVNNRKCNLS